MSNAEDIAHFGQSNLEAALKSSQILVTGWQDITRRATETTQARIEETMSALRALAGVKSFRDAVDIQQNFAKSALEKTASEGTQFAEASMKLAERAIAPLTERVTAAMDKLHAPA